MNHSSGRESRIDRIKEISKEIALLSSELEQLLIEPSSSNELRTDICIGDQIEITNNRGSLRGHRATVVGVTNKRFILKLQSGSTIYRAKSNVRKLHHDRGRASEEPDQRKRG